MPLIAQAFAGKLKAFILQINTVEQDDKDAAITAFCNELETDVYNAIKSITITIAPETIVVEGVNSGGPIVATNISPIILVNSVK